jgi:hypothetical protein
LTRAPVSQKAFSGIRPLDLPGFIGAQLLGALCVLGVAGWLLHEPIDVDESLAIEAKL